MTEHKVISLVLNSTNELLSDIQFSLMQSLDECKDAFVDYVKKAEKVFVGGQCVVKDAQLKAVEELTRGTKKVRLPEVIKPPAPPPRPPATPPAAHRVTPPSVLASGSSVRETVRRLNEVQHQKKNALSRWSLLKVKILDSNKKPHFGLDKENGCVKKKAYQQLASDNYAIDDLKTDDETDDEEKPKKEVPEWADWSNLLKVREPNFDSFKVFPVVDLLI